MKKKLYHSGEVLTIAISLTPFPPDSSCQRISLAMGGHTSIQTTIALKQ